MAKKTPEEMMAALKANRERGGQKRVVTPAPASMGDFRQLDQASSKVTAPAYTPSKVSVPKTVGQVAGSLGIGIGKGALELGALGTDLLMGPYDLVMGKINKDYKYNPYEIGVMPRFKTFDSGVWDKTVNKINPVPDTGLNKVAEEIGAFLPSLAVSGGLTKAAGLMPAVEKAAADVGAKVATKLPAAAAKITEGAAKTVPDMFNTYMMMEAFKPQEERMSFPEWSAYWLGGEVVFRGAGAAIGKGYGVLKNARGARKVAEPADIPDSLDFLDDVVADTKPGNIIDGEYSIKFPANKPLALPPGRGETYSNIPNWEWGRSPDFSVDPAGRAVGRNGSVPALIEGHNYSYADVNFKRSADSLADQDTVNAFVDEALNSARTEFKRLPIRPVSAEEASVLKNLLGKNVSNFTHEISNDDLIHAMKHGNKSIEARKGQEAITAEDLKRIPEIITDYDSITRGSITDKGRKSVIYQKRVNGNIFYVEVMHQGKGTLRGKTMWKEPSRSLVTENVPQHTSVTEPSLTSSSKSNIPPAVINGNSGQGGKFKLAAEQDLAVLQKAMANRGGPFSLNKVNLAPEAMERADFKAANAIAEKLGLRLVAFKGTSHRGMQTGRTIYLNKDMKDPLSYVLWHEIAHTMETTHPEHYAKLMDIALDHIKDAEGLQSHYTGFKYALEDMPHEFAADVFAEALDTPGFFARVAEKSPEMVKPLLEAIDALVAQIKAMVSKNDTILPYLKDLETMQQRIRQEVAKPYFKEAMGEKQFVDAFGGKWDDVAAKAKGEVPSPDVIITGKEFGEGLSAEELRRVASQYAKENFQGRAIKNADTGYDIKIPASGIRHLVSLSGDIRKVQLLHKLPEIIEKSRYVSSEKPYKADQNIRAIHRFQANGQIGEEVVNINSVIRETNEGKLFYDYRLSNIEKEPIGTLGSMDLDGPKPSSATDSSLFNIPEDKPKFKLGSSPIDDVKAMIEYGAGHVQKGFKTFEGLMRKQYGEQLSGYSPEQADQLIKYLWGRAKEYTGRGETVIKYGGQESPVTKATSRFKTNTLTKSEFLQDPDVQRVVQDTELLYEIKPNRQSIQRAAGMVADDLWGTAERIKNEGLQGAEDAVASGIITNTFRKEAQATGDYSLLTDWIKIVQPKVTDVAQTLQALSTWKSMTVDGALNMAARVVNTANKQIMGKNKFARGIDLTADDVEWITKKMDAIEGMPDVTPADLRKRELEFAQVKAYIADKVPAEAAEKIRALQRIMMLLNPRTVFSRNILGNALLGTFENLKDIPGSLADIGMSKITGERTTMLPGVTGLKTQGKGMYTGVKNVVEDIRHGVDTSPTRGQYELPEHRVFSNKVLNFLDQSTTRALQLGDRPFFQAAYDESIRQQLKLSGLREPTEAMKNRAFNVAKDRTFQNDSAIARGVLNLRGSLNDLGAGFGIGNKDFGIGNIILPFAKTPANIIDKAIDYTPVGFIRAGMEATRLSKGTFDQKRFVDLVGRSVVGTGLIMLGYDLAKRGVITGGIDKDADVREMKKSIGILPYSFNSSAAARMFNGEKIAAQKGDTIRTYDWAQPISVALAIGADLYKAGKERKAASNIVYEGIKSGGNTLLKQSALQGVSKMMGGYDTMAGVLDAIFEFPLQFIPTIAGQASRTMDDKARSTYDPSLAQELLNKGRVKVPGLRNSLYERVDTMGKVPASVIGGNTLFNTYFNPGSTQTYNPSPAQEMVMDIYNKSGETIQFPRVVAKTINGKALTAKQLHDYQLYVGQRTATEFNLLAHNKFFRSLEPEEQAKELQKILTEINTRAKEELGLKEKSVKNEYANLKSGW